MFNISYLYIFIYNRVRQQLSSHLKQWISFLTKQKHYSLFAIIITSSFITGCSWTNTKLFQDDEKRRLSERVIEYGQPVPKGGGVYKIGKPYQIDGKWYYPKKDRYYDKVGVASWYGSMFHGRYTANGEIYDMDALTAAHPTLPIPSYVRVVNRENGRSVVLRVNDRGPYANDRIIDLSRKAARILGFERRGTAPVRVTYLKPAPLNGNDSYEKRYIAQKRWKTPRKRYANRHHKRYAYNSRKRYRTKRYDNIRTGAIRRGNQRRNTYRRQDYAIQAGAFYSWYNARKLRRRLSRYGHAYIKTQRHKRYPMYRVLVGPYKHKAQARRAMNRMSYSGIHDTIIVSR